MEESAPVSKTEADLSAYESGSRERLQQIIDVEVPITKSEFKESLTRYCEAYYGPSRWFQRNKQPETIFAEQRRMRVFLVRKLVDFFYPHSPPQTLVELGSAGDISPALALPQTRVVSVDNDPEIFLNMPYNLLPRQFLKEARLSTRVLSYDEPNIFSDKTNRFKIVKDLIQNWEPMCEDANQLPLDNASIDCVLVQGTPDMLDFVKEMARIVKPSSHIIAVIQEEGTDPDAESAYMQRKYNTYPDYSFVPDDTLIRCGLDRVTIPDELKGYEHLHRKKYPPDKHETSFGYVFEVFRKSNRAVV